MEEVSSVGVEIGITGSNGDGTVSKDNVSWVVVCGVWSLIIVEGGSGEIVLISIEELGAEGSLEAEMGDS